VVSPLASIYRPGFGLLTDLYQLTMAAGYHHRRIHQRRAIFHLFYRKPPFGGDFALAAGLPLVVDLIQNFRVSVDDVQYLGQLKGPNDRALFREPFLNFLQRMRFTGELFAIPEGEVVLPHEPLLRIEGPLVQLQLLETALLTLVNFSTLIATKAARIKAAAGDDPVLEFGLRRAQGIDGGLTASRSAYLGGCDATSNVWAGRHYGIPVRGTHAHSWVMVFPDESTSFAAYAEAMPDNCTFLVDTYDTLTGVENAIRIGRQLRARGHELQGIRLDSGDLADLSKRARTMLDEAGFPDAAIVASDSLDEYAVRELKSAGARINVWGIGTRLATAYDQPALGGVYKLAAIQNENGQWMPKVKRSETAIKSSYPGRLCVRRHYGASDRLLGADFYNAFTGTPPPPHGTQRSEEVLRPVLKNGELIAELPGLPRTRVRALRNWQRWNAVDMATFPHGPAPELRRQQLDLLGRDPVKS
jgi:nicotinate phosphoribosyltransferase